MSVDQLLDPVPTFGGRIRDLRRAAGLSQREVAARIGIDFTYLSKLENDHGEPPGEATIRGLADVFDVKSEELLALAGKVPPELKEIASRDPRFALLLRRLPSLTKADLDEVYRHAGMDDELP